MKKKKEPTDDEINEAALKHEQYHLNGMISATNFNVKFAAMCCANSFVDGINWYKKQIKK